MSSVRHSLFSWLASSPSAQSVKPLTLNPKPHTSCTQPSSDTPNPANQDPRTPTVSSCSCQLVTARLPTGSSFKLSATSESSGESGSY